jgi:methylated-DNA-protein-cysteine methyltransferase related protein
MSTAKHKKPVSKDNKERLNPVTPSGKKEGSLAGLIYDLVRQVPAGRVTTYGAVAKTLGIPNPRMVGRAMGLSDTIGGPFPAHRVVNSTGHLSGDHQISRRKALEKEGIKVKGDKIIEFRTLFWDPSREL